MEVGVWGEREIIYLSLHCHHQNDFCIKMDSDESHFNVSVGSIRRCFYNLSDREAEWHRRHSNSEGREIFLSSRDACQVALLSLDCGVAHSLASLAFVGVCNDRCWSL